MAKRYYCVKTCLGKYSKWFRVLYGSKRFRDEIKTIEKFFYSYSTKRYLRQFTEEEVDDWAIERGKTVSPARVAIELGRIKRFWRWVQENLGFELPEPVTKTYKRIKAKVPPNSKKTLSLLELKVICSKIEEVSLQRMILAVLLGGIFEPHRGRPFFHKLFRNTARGIGMDYTWRDFVRSVPKLRLSILQDFRYQLSDSLPFKAQGHRAALRHVNIAGIDTVTFDVGTVVIDSNNDNSPIVGVSQSDNCVEGQSPAGGG